MSRTWRLRTKLGLYVGINRKAESVFTADEREALVFDDRDNQHIKWQFAEITLGQPLEVEMLASHDFEALDSLDDQQTGGGL